MREYKGKAMRELRCNKCRALLATEYIYAGRLLIKCYKCNTLNYIETKGTKGVLLEQRVQPTKFEKKSKGGE